MADGRFECRAVRYSRHAIERMFQRGIPPEAVAAIIASGRVIADYPDDRPYPSMLLLGSHAGEAVHVVLARDNLSGDCQVVTVYRPDPGRWNAGFEKRKKP